MRNRTKALLSLLTASVLLILALTGCGNQDDKGSTGTSSTPVESSSVDNSAVEGEGEDTEFTYPYEPTTELSVNYGYDIRIKGADPSDPMYLPTNGINVFDTYTGTYVYSNGVSARSNQDDFTMMLVEGKLPDMICNNFEAEYNGGAAAAIDDGFIIDLNTYAEYMPNYLAFLEENPKIKELVTTADGRIWCFADVKSANETEEEIQGLSTGISLRKDVLDELGLPVPTTLKEFYTALKTVKEKTSLTPFSCEMRWIYGGAEMAHGISNAFNTPVRGYVTYDGTTVLDAVYTDEAKAFFQELAKWWNEGLIDPNIASVSKGDVRGNLAQGNLFACLQGGTYTAEAAMASTVEGLELITILPLTGEGNPVVKAWTKRATDYIAVGNYDTIGSYNFSISTKCSNIEAAMRYCDYMFTEEGMHLYRHGLQGVSWDYDAEGNIALTELITNDEWDRKKATARLDYCKAQNYVGVAGGDSLYAEDWEIENAAKKLADARSLGYALQGMGVPSTTILKTFLTEDEVSELDQLTSGVDTYWQEKISALIFGTESFDNWESLKQVGLQDYGDARRLEIYQMAYDRYVASVQEENSKIK